MILTLPVLLYQLLFVVIMFVASRFGRKARWVALVLSLTWTATHLFFPPLVVLQTIVIVASFYFFRPRRDKYEAPFKPQ